ncbi:MAG: zf-TFIIB domain-containing protein [Chloroflexi bacterium]|nr:zf-TFIIB domain-containing protein [Chloroflexota bacterium]
MICPSCRNQTIVVEHKRIELDYCPKCHGVWFDSGELELLLSGKMGEHNKMFQSPETRIAEKKRKCPICRRKMRKTPVGQQPDVLVDVCPAGDGIWFDGGELDQLTKSLDKKAMLSGSQPTPIAFVGEALKHRE